MDLWSKNSVIQSFTKIDLPGKDLKEGKEDQQEEQGTVKRELAENQG